MRRNTKLLVILLFIIGIITACNSANTGSREAENKPAETAKKTPFENKNIQPTTVEVKKDETITVIDGRDDREEKKATEAEKQLVNKEFKLNETAIMKKSQFECDEGTEEGVEIIGVADGSFTKPDSSQKAFLYERCRAGRSFGIGGILVMENGKAVTHYTYGENGLDSGIFSLPDVNKDGLSELVLVGVGSGQGFLTAAISVFEFKNGNFNYLRNATTFDDNSGAVEDEAKIKTTAYKISVQPAANPIFFRETYEKKGNAEKWSLIKKSEKFSLDKSEPGKYVKIS